MSDKSEAPICCDQPMKHVMSVPRFASQQALSAFRCERCGKTEFLISGQASTLPS
jgi:hypothetical protein